jgi:hypothetical protein
MTPLDHDDHRQSDENRTALFLAVFRLAIKRGFYADAFGKMADRDVMGLVANYIAHHTENLTIFDPHFLECLYGDEAIRKAHWLIERRMRRLDIVPALYKDLHNVTIVPVTEETEPAALEIGPDIAKSISAIGESFQEIFGDDSICPTCSRRNCSCKKNIDTKKS